MRAWSFCLILSLLLVVSLLQGREMRSNLKVLEPLTTDPKVQPRLPSSSTHAPVPFAGSPQPPGEREPAGIQQGYHPRCDRQANAPGFCQPLGHTPFLQDPPISPVAEQLTVCIREAWHQRSDWLREVSHGDNTEKGNPDRCQVVEPQATSWTIPPKSKRRYRTGVGELIDWIPEQVAECIARSASALEEWSILHNCAIQHPTAESTLLPLLLRSTLVWAQFPGSWWNVPKDGSF